MPAGEASKKGHRLLTSISALLQTLIRRMVDRFALRMRTSRLFLLCLTLTLLVSQVVTYLAALAVKGSFTVEEAIECLLTSSVIATCELAFLAILIHRLRDEIGRRRGAEESLRDANSRLEARVAERTSELQLARLQAEQASLAKSRFLAAASHDLRQPFQAMRLFHSALETAVADPRQCEMLAGLGRAMGTGESLLTALLDVAKLDAGQAGTVIEPVAVRDVFAAVIADCQPLAADKGLRFKCHCPDVTVMADRTSLCRIVTNLMTNALRYTERGGVLLACRRRAGALSIEVWDTGIGIAPHQLDSIFEEFYQVGNVERDRTRGLGLGLSIVKRLCLLMHYRVSVRSCPGRGSVFAVSLPLTSRVPTPAATATVAA